MENVTNQWIDPIRAQINTLLASHCMPALVGWKPANLINVNKCKIPDGTVFITILREQIQAFPVRVEIIYENQTMLLLLLFRETFIRRYLAVKESRELLMLYGYEVWEEPDVILKQWKERYRRYKEEGEEFPHEIGLLLGYPPEDVAGYINHQGKDYLLCGFWKVYHNISQAEALFQCYRNLRSKALQLTAEGRSLQEIMNFYDRKEAGIFIGGLKGE